MAAPDRSVLEGKPVAELKEIAKSLAVKTTGMKKAEIIDAIANGGTSKKAASTKTREKAPQASLETAVSTSAQASANGNPTDKTGAEKKSNPARDETAMDDRDHRNDDRRQQRRPQGRNQGPRPREKAEPREGRGRRRRRNRGGGGGGGGGIPHYLREEQWSDEDVDDSDAEVRTGVLDLLPEGYGFLRTSGYLPGDKDVYVSVSQVRRLHLRKGDEIKGSVRSPKESEKYQALLKVHSINGMEPEHAQKRPRFADLTPLYPQDRMTLEQAENPRAITSRIIDLISPIGKGQRGMIVSPPKAGKTSVMKEIANSVRANNPEVHLIVLLVDERPEEVTDMQRSVDGEVVYSTFDRPSDDHIQVTELTLERAKRLVEMDKDVMILLDGITRLSRAYNLATPASGRILSGGVDSTALYPPKRFFGAARNIEEGGSLTILATALVETGSRMDEVIFEEFKGTGNWELRLDRKMSEKRIFPAIDIQASGTRKEELLLTPEELQLTWRLRRVLHALADGGALELLIDKMKATNGNAQFLREISKAPVKGE